jgi:hypothetical protein
MTTPRSAQAQAFADACWDNALDELRAALRGAPDPVDCATWHITPDEWREVIATTLAQREAEGLDVDQESTDAGIAALTELPEEPAWPAPDNGEVER